MVTAKISSVGCWVPPKVMTNQDLEKLVDTNDAWIQERTGIRERHIADASVATSDMAAEAAKVCLANRGIAATEVEAIIVCTITPDMFFPATACLVQNLIGAKGAWGFDLLAACSGFVYGITTAAQLVRSGTHKKVLVIGADKMSGILNYKDRSTCVLFGDAAGAFLIEPGEEGEGFIGFQNEIDGSGGEALKMPAGGSRLPSSIETVQNDMHFVHQDGSQVFKYAVRKMYEAARDLLQKNGLTQQDIKLFVPHQANKRIICAVADRLGISMDRVMINIDRYGNTTAATIPLATSEAIEQGKLKKGDLVVFASVGAGFTVGATLWRWSF